MPELELIHENNSDLSPCIPATETSEYGNETTIGVNASNDTDTIASLQSGVLTSEQILREVVDRKCRLQSITQFNLESAIQV